MEYLRAIFYFPPENKKREFLYLHFILLKYNQDVFIFGKKIRNFIIVTEN